MTDSVAIPPNRPQSYFQNPKYQVVARTIRRRIASAVKVTGTIHRIVARTAEVEQLWRQRWTHPSQWEVLSPNQGLSDQQKIPALHLHNASPGDIVPFTFIRIGLRIQVCPDFAQEARDSAEAAETCVITELENAILE